MSLNTKLAMIAFIAALTGLSGTIIAKDKFVGQIPNGAKYKCVTCHVSQSGGGSRNSFGKSISQFIVSGNVKWGQQLAAIDSDNDGFTNGTELGDANGVWIVGKPSPGNKNEISMPGDPKSKPAVNSVEVIEYVSNIFAYPNPAVSLVRVNYSIPESVTVRFDVYNVMGIKVFGTSDIYVESGNNSFDWDTRDNFGVPVMPGNYVMAIQAAGGVSTINIIINK